MRKLEIKKVLPLVLGIFVSMRLSAVGIPNPVYYVIMLLVGLVNIWRIKNINRTLFIFILWCIVTLLIRGEAFLFKSNVRLILFIMMVVFTLGDTSILYVYRSDLLRIIMKVSSILVISSVLSGLLGLNLFDNGRIDYRGFFTHSMIYGPIAGLLFVRLVYSLLISVSKVSLWNTVLMLFYFIGVAQSGSRAALLAVIVSTFWLVNKLGRRRVGVFMLIFIIPILLT